MNLQFTKFAAMPEEVIEKYASKVPDELVELWQQYGLGFLLDGYLKIINPEEYIEFVQNTYFRGDLSIPIFITAFGDIITLEERDYLRIVDYKEENFTTILEDMYYFLEDLEDEELLKDYFDIPLYEEAVKEYGSLDYNQCFGFVPLLVLGGKRDLVNIDKVGIKEHLELITQITGGVGF
ncbi:T6SS immunity protein Tdi1 domain-containing protein [Streptococcus infantis]|jgi:hypothetical protein|uniref:T6SS immunity protein Tdi1 domain-containing protein n=1 Tax=Streptococcus infantis TaxID=68892 RepID=UPI0039C20A03